jgi:polysaccharide pyruvyl transferase WcaK-like protein
MNTYYIHGWHGQLNAGDDAFAIVSNWGLRKYCQADTVLMSSDISGILHREYNIELINDKNERNFYISGTTRLRRFFYFKKAKYFVLAGGSLFTLDMTKELLNDSTLKSHKTVALGVSVGPFVSLEHEKEVIQCLNKMNYVSFRDDYSYNWADSQGLKCYYSQSFDLATLLPKACNMKIKDKPHPPKLGISLLAFNFLKNKDKFQKDVKFVQNIAQKTYRIVQEKNTELVVYSLCRNPFYNDDLVSDAFIDALPNNHNVKIYKHNGDAQQTLASLQECSHVVSMRLHGAVFSYINQTPMLILNYRSKCRDFADTVGLEKNFILDLDNFDFEEYEMTLEQLLNTQCIQSILPIEVARSRSLISFEEYNKWE